MKCLICNMEINENNALFNKEAFLQSNEENNIYHCPFCGVSSKFLKDEGESLLSKTLKLDENTIKILDHAMKLEVFNGEFYGEAAKLAKDLNLKKVFEALSRIELLHAKIHKALGKFTQIPALLKLDYSKYDSDKKLLELAKMREKHAVQYYEKYKHEVSDKIIVEVFEALANVEREHIILTSK